MNKNLVHSKLLRLKELLEIISLSRSSVYSRLNKSSPFYDPTFPRPIKLCPGPQGAVAWKEAEVYEWLQLKIKERDKEEQDKQDRS